MKAQLKEDKEKFHPITLEITIENKDELYNLWHRFYLSDLGIQDISDGKFPIGDFDSMKIWSLLDDKLEES